MHPIPKGLVLHNLDQDKDTKKNPKEYSGAKEESVEINVHSLASTFVRNSQYSPTRSIEITN